MADKPRRVLVMLALLGCAACGDSKKDSCAGAAAEPVKASRASWQELAKGEGGRTYWYEEENCVLQSSDGRVTVVQVSAGVATIVRTRSIELEQCQARVNRYTDFAAITFEQLYARCEQLVERSCETDFESDEQEVVRSCVYKGDADCFDACGEGFHLRRWDFGRAPSSD